MSIVEKRLIGYFTLKNGREHNNQAMIVASKSLRDVWPGVRIVVVGLMPSGVTND